MQLLAIETSTDACSLALYCDGRVFTKDVVIPQQHSQRLLPMVTDLLHEADATLSACDAIAFGRGPGSFTGIRMALGVAQGLAFGLEVPVIAISTLEALAWAAKQERPHAIYLATLDARMSELYWAIYEDCPEEGWVLRQDEQLNTYSDLLAFLKDFTDQPIIVCGPGWSAYAPCEPPLPTLHCLAPEWPSASAIVELALTHWAERLNPADALPSYVRNDVARVKGS